MCTDLATLFTLVECTLLLLGQTSSSDLAHSFIIISIVERTAMYAAVLAADHGKGGWNRKGEVETFSQRSGGSG